MTHGSEHWSISLDFLLPNFFLPLCKLFFAVIRFRHVSWIFEELSLNFGNGISSAVFIFSFGLAGFISFWKFPGSWVFFSVSIGRFIAELYSDIHCLKTRCRFEFGFMESCSCMESLLILAISFVLLCIGVFGVNAFRHREI